MDDGGKTSMATVGVSDTYVHVVVVGVLRETSVEERPGEIVDGILLVLDDARDRLRVEVVVQPLVQVRLYSDHGWVCFKPC